MISIKYAFKLHISRRRGTLSKALSHCFSERQNFFAVVNNIININKFQGVGSRHPPLFFPIDIHKQNVYKNGHDHGIRGHRNRAFFHHGKIQAFSRDVLKRAVKRLTQLDAAMSIDDLRMPPSNRLEALSGDRGGQWSIRINDQWRVCFRFEGKEAHDVEIVDYH